MVPTDRPGPAMQMIRGFLMNIPYETPLPFDITFTALKPEYQIQLKIATSVPITRSRTWRLFAQSHGYSDPRSDIVKPYSVGDPPVGSKKADKITDLPGVTFKVTFNQYSGYLEASKGNFLHYWFDICSLFVIAVQHSSIILQIANVLFIESPRDVGFSYRSNTVPPDTLYNDTKTAADNVLALKSFFKRFPEYKNREFYVSGESYGGVYTPTLVDALIKRIQDGSMKYVNLKGLAIGNGEISELQQINSAPQLLYYRGVLGKRELDRLIPCCTKNGVYDNYCDLTQYIHLDPAGNAHAKNESNLKQCGQLVEEMGFWKVWESGNDVYNTYQDCYAKAAKLQTARRHKRNAGHLAGLTLTNESPFINQINRINYMSTDPLGTFPCYMDHATETYLNTKSVQQAIHVQSGLPRWTDCNVFETLNKLRSQIVADEWFIEKLAQKNKMKGSERDAWNYTHPGGYLPRIAGYVKHFTHPSVRIDLLTIKGGSHFVPTDRPAPTLQMIANFIQGKPYSTQITCDTTPKPLLTEYVPKPDKVDQKMADKIYELPGATFAINFNQYSGYLNSSTAGNYLHYW
ncbi:unnamed protein product [Anisakis simplex]|uniref:Carboxypeptidase n=1 Tax=Anisakis simplex TaxID=6269 RepID=A0A0M3K8V4_ANISI|nr:unnamed protein product [Anisakis simplex]